MPGAFRFRPTGEGERLERAGIEAGGATRHVDGGKARDARAADQLCWARRNRTSVADSMAPDILAGLKLHLDDQSVPLRIVTRSNGAANLAGHVVVPHGARLITLTIDAPRTVVPAGGDSTLAIMLEGLLVEPVDAAVDSTR